MSHKLHVSLMPAVVLSALALAAWADDGEKVVPPPPPAQGAAEELKAFVEKTYKDADALYKADKPTEASDTLWQAAAKVADPGAALGLRRNALFIRLEGVLKTQQGRQEVAKLVAELVEATPDEGRIAALREASEISVRLADYKAAKGYYEKILAAVPVPSEQQQAAFRQYLAQRYGVDPAEVKDPHPYVRLRAEARLVSDQLEMIDKPAPELKVQTTEGKTVALSDYKGEVLLIDFWATWCPTCMTTLPELKKLAGERAEDGLRVLGLNDNEDVGQLEAFMKTDEAPGWPQVFMGERKREISKLFHVRGLPTLVLIDRAGVVRGFALEHRMLGDALEAALKKK